MANCCLSRSLQRRCPTNRWTRAAGARFVNNFAPRGGACIRPPRQLNLYVGYVTEENSNPVGWLACGLRAARFWLVALILARSPRLLVSAKRKAPVARYNLGRHNKSLDASGTSGLVIENLSVMWLIAAASTQPLDRFFSMDSAGRKYPCPCCGFAPRRCCRGPSTSSTF